MSVSLLEQEKSYRRGVVLGLTMAEVVILVLFALLLAFAVRMENQERSIASLQDQITQAEQKATTAEQRKAEALAELETVRRHFPEGNDFDESFKKLVLADRENVNLRKEVDRLKEEVQSAQEIKERATKADDLERRNRELEADRQFADSLRRALNSQNLPPDDLAQRAATLVALGVAAERAAGDGKDVRKLVTEATKAAEEERRRADNLQGQLAQMKKMFTEAGRGTEKPACWATKDGRIEYIFDVALRTGGVVMRDNALPHRAEEQAKLPVNGIRYMTEMSPSELRAAALPLYRWSEEHDCRFFVRVFDQTSAADKGIYKKMLWTVGEFFYYYEPRSGAF